MARHLQPDDVPMSVGDHLQELQRRIVLAAAGVGVAAAVMLVFGRWLILVLCLPLAHTLHTLGHPPQTYTRSPPEGFMIYLKVSLIAGLIVASPWVVYQIWRFIASGLYQSERNIAMTLIPFSAGMTVLGVMFMYFIMLPVCLFFFLMFASSFPDVGTTDPSYLTTFLGDQAGVEQTVTAPAPDAGGDPAPASLMPVVWDDPIDPADGQYWIKLPEFEVRVHAGGRTRSIVPTRSSLMTPLIDPGQYISFVTMLTVGIVVAFQVPVIMLILGWTGLVEPAWFAQYRRHSVFGCFVMGAILTPADVPSMFLLAIPLWGLFELGLMIMRIMHGRRRDADPAEQS